MTPNLKAILVDDSEQSLRLLYLMIKELAPEIEIVAITKSANEAIIEIEKHQPDILFLDIEMPEKSGLLLVEDLLQRQIKCDVVFTTAYSQYAIRAFRLSATDYLLKPIDEQQLRQSIDKIINNYTTKKELLHLKTLLYNFNTNTNKMLTVPLFKGYEYIPINDIEYIEAQGSYTCIFYSNKQIIVSKNLKYFEESLRDEDMFFRPHRSFLINIHRIQTYSKSKRGIITMISGKEIKLARDRRSLFFEILNKKSN
ncbi:MAG: LytTR family DNA-binding domain-containing protein [Bacteroidia bacterium]|nr:LytTR family DNA-binding domain-containing protein [Bacteroidia bacterium]